MRSCGAALSSIRVPHRERLDVGFVASALSAYHHKKSSESLQDPLLF